MASGFKTPVKAKPSLSRVVARRLYKVFPSANVARRTEFEPISIAEILLDIILVGEIISELKRKVAQILLGLKIIEVVFRIFELREIIIVFSL